MLSFGVLGPLEAWDPDVVPLKGPRHRTILARLLIARGRVVPVDVLVDDVWSGAPPSGALGALRTFVADLRRALEPDRKPRTPPRVLITAPPGYALRASSVDAWRFEQLVADGSLTALDEALSLWRGPAYAEWPAEGWARAEIDRLDDLHQLARERRAAALVTAGRPGEAAPDLRALVAAHPWREESWRLLALSLYRSGRQGDALSALREARAVLVGSLGVDPGPALRALETDILTQSVAEPVPPAQSGRDDELQADVVDGELGRLGRGAAAVGSGELQAGSVDGERGRLRGGPALRAGSADRELFGRDAELQRLRDSTAAVALVEGEAGAGKSALVEAFAREQEGRGWTVRWGRAGEYEGAPGTWPWTDLRTAGTELAASAPVLLVAEDVHRADRDVWDVLATLPDGVRLLATARDSDPSDAFTAFLARLARAEPLRIRLAGLAEPATAALVREVVGRGLGAREVHLLQERTAGNPFFVRELARLVAAEGPAALRTVPPGVRDVIRHRLAQLPEPTRQVLRQASVLGRDIDPELLAALARTDVVDALEAATRAGFLTDGTRFAHILVRDTIYGDLATPRRQSWHTQAGEVAHRLTPNDAATLAYHFAAAGTRATSERAARYSAEAARSAEHRNNPHEAARLWRQAVTHDGGTVDSLLGLSRALAVIGHLDESRHLRAEALAKGSTAEFAVPAIWPRNDDDHLSAEIVTAARIALPGTTGEARARLLIAEAMELRGRGDPRGADEAYALSGANAQLRALALNARFLHCFPTPGRAAERLSVAEELLDLSRTHGLVTFEVLAHLIALQSSCALNDPAAADAHAAAADALSETYSLPVVPVFTEWYAAMRTASEPSYRRADAHLATAQMPGMRAGLLGLALLSLDRLGPNDDLGPYEPWARPLLLTRAGRPDEARAALRSLPPSPRDLLWEARLCVAAQAAIELDDTGAHRALAAELSPAAHEHAAGSGVLTFGPVADFL
ncbi:BTAD domain-containing putative transcriptional regulator [Dactylosporangium sp. CS-047395]|uniref:BTAD domain-containing putative transcriptional regulator n=1 Tax=Dactylosporangium sp. CS-047395 TaxID=3239936 RepID=UPI003D8CD005